jgi:hypothetical protein
MIHASCSFDVSIGKGVFVRMAFVKARGYLCLLFMACKPCLEGIFTIGLKVYHIVQSVVLVKRSTFRHA